MTHPLRIFCIVAVALALLVPAAALLRPLAVLDEVVVVEDAYLSMTLARSIAAGHGPWFGNGHTNGFQPLYVFLLVPFYKWAAPGAEWPVRAALLLLCTASAGALAVMLRLLWRLRREAAPLLVLAGAWVCSAAVLANALNGLETALSILLQWTAFACFYRRWWLPLCRSEHDGAALATHPRGALELGAWLGLAVFARVDNVFLFPALFGPLGIAWARRGVPARRIIGFAALATLMALLVNLPWFLYSWHYTGAIFPTSGRAVRWLALFHVDWNPTFGNWYLGNFRLAALRLSRQSPVLLGAAGFLVAAGLALRLARRPRREPASEPGWWTLHAPLLLFGLFLLLGYTWLLGGFWYFTRYLFPVVVVVLFLMAEGAGRLLQGLPRRTRTAALTLLILLLTVGQAAQLNFRGVFTGADQNRWGYRDLGLWAARRFPPGTRVASMQSGALSYFAPQLTVINLDGVVNHAAYLAQRENRLFQYAREERIEYFIGWRMDLRFLGKTSLAFDPTQMSFLGPAEGFKSLDTDWLVFKLNYGDAPPVP